MCKILTLAGLINQIVVHFIKREKLHLLCKKQTIIKGEYMKLTLIFLSFCFTLYADAPKFFLLKIYKNDINVTNWVMSEKLDGVRAYWDGKHLISRSGKFFNAPEFFTKGFPSFALDGEIWSKRGDFENIVSIVKSKNSLKRWDELTFNVFELPYQEGDLFTRLGLLKNFLQLHPNKKLRLIEQVKIKGSNEVKNYFDKLVSLGAEGIVIRNPSLKYYTGRTNSSLKYKPYMDDECKVVSITEGNGKFKGMIGSVKCMYKNKIIKIGSGFTDEQRSSLSLIKKTISFKYYGLTRLGNPKYPVFLRVRSDENLSL